MPQGPEDIAREQIDRMLIQSGWAVQDTKVVNLYARQGESIRELHKVGEDIRHDSIFDAKN